MWEILIAPPSRPPFLDLICPVFEAAFTQSQHIAIDESVITYMYMCMYKGWVSFLQYLIVKRNPNL